MLAGCTASGRIRKSPALIHSRSIAARSSCEASTRPLPAPAGMPAVVLEVAALSLILQSCWTRATPSFRPG